jgi:hypothetical protein
VNVGLEDPVLRLLDPPRVKVTARITEVRGQRTFARLPVAVRGGSVPSRPVLVRVVVAGPVSALDRLAAGDVVPHVRLDDAPAGASARFKVAVEFAPGFEGLTAAEVDPAEITLRARK